MLKIDEEDVADAAKRAAQQAATRAYIADFLRQQACSFANAYVGEYSQADVRDTRGPNCHWEALTVAAGLKCAVRLIQHCCLALASFPKPE